jgi:SAM-dependent methyltransferase
MVPTAVKRLLKRSDFLVGAVYSVRNRRYTWKWSGGLRTNHEIVERLGAFSPSFPGLLQARGAMALESAQQIFPLLSSLVVITTSAAPIAPQPITAIYPEQTRSKDTTDLGNLLEQYGSDKSTYHDYHLLYAPLLTPHRSETPRLLEIGLGTNNLAIVSNMGKGARPGGSLRAFRDFLPHAQIFGADVDRQILFEEDRIRTFYVDQTREESFEELAVNLSNAPFDLVIDDGLHAPNANIRTMLFSFQILKPGGRFVVEDIAVDAIPVWQTVAALLPSAFKPTLIQAKNGLLFMVQSPTSRGSSRCPR